MQWRFRFQLVQRARANKRENTHHEDSRGFFSFNLLSERGPINEKKTHHDGEIFDVVQSRRLHTKVVERLDYKRVSRQKTGRRFMFFYVRGRLTRAKLRSD